MECPYCKKKYSNIIRHLENHGCTHKEAERMIQRYKENGDQW
jgi:hypothetical protein